MINKKIFFFLVILTTLVFSQTKPVLSCREQILLIKKANIAAAYSPEIQQTLSRARYITKLPIVRRVKNVDNFSKTADGIYRRKITPHGRIAMFPFRKNVVEADLFFPAHTLDFPGWIGEDAQPFWNIAENNQVQIPEIHCTLISSVPITVQSETGIDHTIKYRVFKNEHTVILAQSVHSISEIQLETIFTCKVVVMFSLNTRNHKNVSRWFARIC